jgi:hypothetical protein
MADFFPEECTRRQLLKKTAHWSLAVGTGVILFDRLGYPISSQRM